MGQTGRGLGWMRGAVQGLAGMGQCGMGLGCGCLSSGAGTRGSEGPAGLWVEGLGVYTEEGAL